MNEFSLQHFPCFDEKWAHADLESSLRSPELVSILWNNLIKDAELITTRHRTVANAAGHTAYLAANGKFYCGIGKLECNCNKNCTGVCHPRSHCNCKACRAIVDSDTERTAGSSSNDTADIEGSGCGASDNTNVYGHLNSADGIVESWLWCPTPSEYNCIYEHV